MTLEQKYDVQKSLHKTKVVLLQYSFLQVIICIFYVAMVSRILYCTELLGPVMQKYIKR